MADDGGSPDRSAAEIRQLLRRLDPSVGNHKDRVRRLARFRNYVEGTKTGGIRPQFFDDDIMLLMLGSLVLIMGSEADEYEENLYGLLQAAGSPSTEHEHMLKRSARHAMSLLKFLVVDTPSDDGGQNPFSVALCGCSLSQLRHMNLDLHMEGDRRGGAKEDACEIVVMLMTTSAENWDEESTVATPHGPPHLGDLLTTDTSRQAFQGWLQQSGTRAQQQAVQKALERSPKKKKKKQPSPPKSSKKPLADVMEEVEDDGDEHSKQRSTRSPAEIRPKRKKKSQSPTKRTSRASRQARVEGPALKWEDTELYRQQQEQEALATNESMRESKEAAKERARAAEKRLKMQGKDPLGLRRDLDLREIQTLRVELLEQALKDLEEEIRDMEQTKSDEAHLKSLESQKESLEAILDSMGPREDEGGKSIIPTDSHFDPLLFLTLVHRNATYDVLNKSIDRLSNKTDNQMNQLQNLVRDNFALFVRCADGIDVFQDNPDDGDQDINERLDRVEAVAESASHQAKTSFKPLLDNTNEVRKVQSALAVLQRVGPILETPHVMRTHLENGRISEALEAYRQVKKIIDEQCNIDIFNHVKLKAAEAARESRRDIEKRLALQKSPLSGLMDGIRDLRELLELDIPEDPHEAETVALAMVRGTAGKDESKGGDEPPILENPLQPATSVGVFRIGEFEINVRHHPPALACLLLQAAHFNNLVSKAIEQADLNARRIYEGESLSSIQGAEDALSLANPAVVAGEDASTKTPGGESGKSKNSGNQWKYDVLDVRVISAVRAVDLAKSWLPRLLHIGTVAREDEKRRAARVGSTRRVNLSGVDDSQENQLAAFEVFLTNISPAVTMLVEHATFCALGSSGGSSGKDLRMTFGMDAPDKLRTLLRSPLPPSQSSTCAKTLADLVKVVVDGSSTANGLRSSDKEFGFDYALSPLDECRMLAEEAVITVERRRCIFAFDVCARTCSTRASGSGRFDGEALLKCLTSLSDELSRAEECSSEIEKGCELVVQRCCDGLAGYVRDRGDSARLRGVSECADALATNLQDVVKEVEFLGGNAQLVEEVMEEDIMGLEGAMFDEFLENVRHNVSTCCRIGWLDADVEEGIPSPTSGLDTPSPSAFPAYLSASLLALVRTRAQVERALGDKVRRSEQVTYQFLAMATAADGVAEGICNEIKARKTKLKVRQADRLANELQFLMNTLKSYLSDETLGVLESTRRTLTSRTGRAGGGFQGGGPDGLAALEDLERLGRVYVLCLGESSAVS